MKAWVKTLLVSHIITQKAGEKKDGESLGGTDYAAF